MECHSRSVVTPLYAKFTFKIPKFKKVFEAVEETKEQLRQWLPWVDGVTCWQDSEKTARLFYSGFIQREKINLAIFSQDQFIGMTGNSTINWSIPCGSIGYWCRLSAQGHGFIREAVAAFTLYAFEEIGFKHLTILCNDENVKSIQVAESLGFKLENRALGLIENLHGKDLVMGRSYVRFSADGLSKENVRW